MTAIVRTHVVMFGPIMPKPPLFDVVAINIRAGSERVMERDQSQTSAGQIIEFAVIRRGVETEFYISRPVWASL